MVEKTAPAFRACGLAAVFLSAATAPLAFAAGIPENAAPAPEALGGLPSLSAPASPPLLSRLTALQASPVETLERLKASAVPADSALLGVLAHPEAVSDQREALTSAIGPEHFSALAATARELGRLAAQNESVRQLLSPGAGPAAAIAAFKTFFDGGSATVDPEILSLGEKIARGITKDENLALVPAKPLRAGDVPTWRLARDGESLRIHYVPEDLRGASRDASMARLMQEIFRAVYSRPDLIEPSLRSDALFETLYDTLETGRVVQKGLRERPGLAAHFSALDGERYGDSASVTAILRMGNLPLHVQFLEGALFESRQGREDPRVQDPRVLDALGATRAERNKILSASPEDSYRLIRRIWPTLQRLRQKSEDEAMSEEKSEEGEANGPEGEDAQEDQTGAEKNSEDASSAERENRRRQVQERMREQEQDFRKSLGKSQGSSRQSEGKDGLDDQSEQGAAQMQAQTGADDALSEKTEKIQEAAEAVRSPGQSAGSTPNEPSDSLEQLLRDWSPPASSGPSEPAPTGENSARRGEGRREDGEIDPSGNEATSDSIGDRQESIERIRSGGLDAAQRRWLDAYLEPVRGMIDTLAYKIRKHLKAAALGRDLTGLFEGDVDEDALPYYKAGVGIMKDQLLPGRPRSRITFLIDLSNSMGRVSGGGSLDHATRALLMGLKAFKQAFKNESGVEIRVVAYNENPELPIIGDYMQVKDVDDAVLYRAIERINTIQNTHLGHNNETRMMSQAVQAIREDMKGHPDTTYALLHIGDGDPHADIAAKIRAIYDDPANARIRFANLAAGPKAREMYAKYQPHSVWARDLSELGAKWAAIVETTFKKNWRGTR